MIMRWLLVLCALTMLAGCSEDDSIGPIQRKPTPQYLGDDSWPDFERLCGIGDTASVDSGFLLTFGETVFDSSLSAHKQLLHLQTVQWYFCYNQYLMAQVNVFPGKIVVSIEGVQLPGNLFQDAFKQSDVSEIFVLEPAKYDIEIRYKQDTGHFVLKVTDTSLEVRTISASIFSLPDSLYWRYRPRSCAFVCGMGLQDTTACSRLLDSILSIVPLKSYQYPATGVRPYPSGVGWGWYVDWGAQYFTYESEADFERAGELLHSYGKAQWAWNSGNDAWLVNYRGKQYMSWYPITPQ